MKACCPEDGHGATDHGMMLMPSDAGLASTCDPVTTDGASAHSFEIPDPLAVGIDLLSPPADARETGAPDFEVRRPREHGPPVYLATLRLRR